MKCAVHIEDLGDGFFKVCVHGEIFEYDHKPDMEEIEDDYINEMAAREIDRHEAEVFDRLGLI